MTEIILDRMLLYQFKNYEELELQLSRSVNCFIGVNGTGKTNILDAIHYLCTTRSYFQAVDSACIRFDAQQASVTGEFSGHSAEEHIVVALRRNQKKVVKRNFKEYDRLAEHIGRFPCVMITPYDIELIWEGSEVRRKFMDTTLAQCSPSYLTAWSNYQRALQHRNTLLKSSDAKRLTKIDLEPWDLQLAQYGEIIWNIRKSFVELFVPQLLDIYQHICGGSEVIGVDYISDAGHGDYFSMLQENVERDVLLGRSTKGIHRDELQFTLHDNPLKKFGSQGQQKSFLIALKLAQYQYLQQQLSFKPILMLDDLFEKIDELRLDRILGWLSNHAVGQIFITDTHAERIPMLLNQYGWQPRIWQIQEGKLTALKSEHHGQ
ncbi:MAG: DNA replication/repair protein RecF [Flavobacteriales bacterium]